MRTWVLVVTASLLGVAFTVALQDTQISGFADEVVSDGGQLLASLLASLGCLIAGRRTTEHQRRTWQWLSAGTGCWAAGQVVWSYYEVVLGQQVPFPSLADVGFLLFPVAAAIGLVIWLGTQVDQLAARGRDILDGAIIAGSLLLLSWITTLGTVVAGGGGNWFSLALSLAYPVGDLILATLVLIALARGTGRERTTLVLLAVGLGGLALADSAYVYLTSTGAYSSANVLSGGWVFGFLYVAVAGLSVNRSAEGIHHHRHLVEPSTTAKPSLLRLALPYVPLVTAGAVLTVKLLTSPKTPTVDLLLGLVLVIIVLTRQFLAMTDNQRLLADLAVARDQLEHQALHDPLTGLANRVLFADRLDRALLQSEADVSVLFCDLDDFKLVNDERGHDVGDAFLRLVAERLLTCVRLTDTVARLGGDEFAILLDDTDDTDDALQVADRVVESIREVVVVAGHPVRASISVGIAHAPRRRVSRGQAAAAEREFIAARLISCADSAMYAAKGAGKGRAVLTDLAADEAPYQQPARAGSS